MKLKKIMLASLVLLAILTIGAVSAQDDLAADENSGDILDAPVDDVDLSSDDSDILEDPDDELPERTSDYYNVTQISKTVFRDYSDNVVFSLPDDATGLAEIYVDNDLKFSENAESGLYDIYVGDWGLNYGNHKATFLYEGDDNYVGFNRTYDFNYAYFYCYIPKNPTLDDCMEVILDYEVSGNIKILIDGKTVYNDAYDDDRITICFDDLTFGTHTYQVSYTGNKKAITQKGSFDLSYLFEMNLPDSSWDLKNPLEVYLALPYDANSNATVICNGKTYSVEVIAGKGYCTLSDFSLGKNVIVAKYSDGKYPLKSINETVSIDPYYDCPTDVEYATNSSIVLILPATAQGTLNAKIDDKPYSKALKDGKAIIPLNDLGVGSHSVEINYTGDFEDLVDFSDEFISVKPSLSIPNAMYLNGSYEVVFNAPESFNGTLSIPQFDINVNVENGKARVPIAGNALNLGYNYIDATFTKDDGREFCYSSQIRVYEDAPDWQMVVDFVSSVNKARIYEDMGPTVRVGGVPNGLEDGSFPLYLDGKRVGAISSDERELEVTTMVKNLANGRHYFTVTYAGNNYFKPSNATVYFDVGYVTIYVPSKVILPSDSEVTVSVPLKATGTVTINVDNQRVLYEKLNIDSDYDSYDNLYHISYDLSTLKFANHEVEVIYSGNYGKVTKKENVTMDYEIYLSTSDYQFAYGDENQFTFSMPSTLKGKVQVLIDGNEYPCSYDEEMGEYCVKLPDTSIGTHNVTITYPGDSAYPAKTVSDYLTVRPKITTGGEFAYKGSAYVLLNLPKDANGTLSVYRSVEEGSMFYASANVENGTVKVPLPTDSVGSFDFTADFDGNYDVSEEFVSYYVRPSITYPSQMVIGEKKNLIFEIAPEQEGELSVYVNDEPYGDYYCVNGKAVVPLSKLPGGTAYIFIGYGIDGTGFEEKYLNIDVITYPAKLLGGKDINMYYCDGKTYSLKVYGINGKLAPAGQLVTVKIGKNKYTARTNSKGIATLKLTALPGKYKIIASYKGTVVTNNLVVKRVISLSSVKIKKSAKSLVLTATLKKGKTPIKDKWVVFKFNGKTLKAKTNKKGIAKVTINKKTLAKLKVGKTIKYQATYLKDTVKKSAKVKK